MLFTLQLFYWMVGRRASKTLNNKDDYFLAGKNVRLFPLMMTFLATQVGGGVILGSANEAYQFGWPVLLYPLGAALGLMILGAGFGRKLAEFQVSTVAEIFEVIYRSVALRKIASILSIITLFMILVAQIIASNKFLFSLGFSNTPLFIAFWAIVIIYTTQGGLKAVISTDMVQAAFFSIIFLACFGFVFYNDAAVASIQPPHQEEFTEVSSKLCGWLLMPLLFMIIEQDMGQRCFAGASTRVVSLAAFFAGVGTLIICIVPIFFGSLAKAKGIQVSQDSSVLMTTIAQTTSPWVTSLMGCAILAAIISTATSLINAISSNISSDFKLPTMRSITTIRMAQGVTAIISTAAIFFAFYFDNIVDVLIQSYELSVSCLFVPIVIALFKKEGHPLAAFAAIICGAIGFFLFRIYPIPFPKEVVSILLSLLGYSCGDILACYQRKNSLTYE